MSSNIIQWPIHSSIFFELPMFSFFCLPLVLFLFFLLFVNVAHGIGSTRVQCPEGHYLSRFSSAFDGTERFYKFGCSKFHGIWTAMFLEEKCESTEMASFGAGADVYLSCGTDQYTVGVQIEERDNNGEMWQFLCCRSEFIQIRTNDCIETKFINDFRRSSSFSSSAQIIRRWQAISENGDRRWWLQICPVDLTIGKMGNEVRAKREVPKEWLANSRFPVGHKPFHPFFQRRMSTIADEQQQRRSILQNKNVNSYAVLGKKGRKYLANPIPTTEMATIKTTTMIAEKEEEEENWMATTTTDQSVDMPKLMINSQAMKPPIGMQKSSRLLQFNERIKARLDAEIENKERMAKMTTTTMETKKKKNGGEKPDEPTEALDYYDMYDDNFDKEKHLGNGGILGGVTDFIQSLQDGLTLAQAVFPANVKFTEKNGPSGAKGFHLKIAVTPPTTAEEVKGNMAEDDLLAFSHDEEEEKKSIMANNNNNLQIGSFLQQTEGKIGPKPKTPTKGANTKELRKEANTIESMLQMIGLCQGHHDDL